MGFFFENLSLQALVAFLLYFAILWVLNSFALKNKWTGLFMYLIIPIVGVSIIWPITAKGTNMDNWFSHAKVLSAAAGCLIFYAFRYSKKIQGIKWYRILPMLILALNMIEAIAREFEIGNMAVPQTVDGMYYMGGVWNQINGWAGILNLILICGWFGMFIMKDKNRTMCWPDMTWWWIIGYDLWNAAYSYNCLGNRSFYVFPVLLVATVIAHKEGKGAWLQHRASTLVIANYIMFTFPHWMVDSNVAVASSWNPNAMILISVAALVWNIVIFVIQLRVIIRDRKNPLTDELFTQTKDYQRYYELKAYYEANPEA